MNARWFDRIIYGGAWKQIRFLIIIVVSLIVLSCLECTGEASIR